MNSSEKNHQSLDIEPYILQLIDATPVPMFISGGDGNLLHISNAFIEFLGFKQAEIYLPDFIVFHQDDFYLSSEIRQTLAQDSSTPLVIEKKYNHRTDKLITTQLTIIAQQNKEGNAIRYFSQIDDLTEREITRDKLQLASLVYAKSSEGMMVTDNNGNILDVNASFSKITGYSKEEVIGKNASMLSSGQQDKLFYKLMWRSINTTGHWKGELWNKRKNGENYPVIISINTDLNKSGEVNKIIALFSDQSKIKAKEKQIFRQAYYDSITGLPNRDLFIERLNHIINLTQSKQNSVALFLLDLDGFKEINDTLGHESGDDVLEETAERLLSCVSSEDVVARLGGDEFTVIVRDVTQVEVTAQAILKKLAETYQLNNEDIYITGSIGITYFPGDSDHVSGLLKNADQAMYSVKKQGRNGYRFFTLSMQEAAQNRLAAINELRQAIDKQQFILHFQPIVDLHTNEIYKAEALVRWLHPDKGLISPDQFIPIAEDTGLIIEIGKWVVREALQQAYVWRETFRNDFQLSVNESPLQFKSDGHSFHEWLAYLKKLNLSGEAVCIEITENLLMDFSESVDKKMQSFKDAGIQISLDDFGTGYASLSYLKRFDIDYLKIDKSYVQNMEKDRDVLILCETIIEMAKKLGIRVIAEGIETEKQLTILTSMGCEYGQGFLFSKPLHIEDFDKLLTERRTLKQ